MANEVDANYEVAGVSNHVAILLQGGQLVNATTGALIADIDGNLAAAEIALSDSGHQFSYRNAAPADGMIADGTYIVRTYLKAGGTLVRSDMARAITSGTTTVGASGGGGGTPPAISVEGNMISGTTG